MTRAERLILLAVLSAGVFLAGLELMITAVALPSILEGLASWTQLRHASWIVNGYLLVYVVAMPLAGRLADLYGARPLFLGALVAFVVGGLLCGAAQTLDQLIAARLVQALGGGALVPVATAAASHLFVGRDRPRALGLVSSLTFLGMAAGPFAGAAILELLDPRAALATVGIVSGPTVDLLVPAWRWVFYLNVPIGIAALAIGWAASTGWETPRVPRGLDILGAVLFSVSLAALIAGVTLADDALGARVLDPTYLPTVLVVSGVAIGAIGVARALRRSDPFVDPRLFTRPILAAASLVALLTGYALATAIVGGAVFVDRVLYGGPDTQRAVLGALAASTAVAALVAGFLVRSLSARIVTIGGLCIAAAALGWMGGWTSGTAATTIALGMALFGAGFGLTVTSRSTAAVEAVDPTSYGVASAAVTVARMIGMAIGLAVLTAYGSTTIERLSASVYATPEGYRQYVPAELRDRPLKDPLVVAALESWAAGEAARVMVGLFVVAGAVTLVAVVPAAALGSRASMLASDG